MNKSQSPHSGHGRTRKQKRRRTLRVLMMLALLFSLLITRQLTATAYAQTLSAEQTQSDSGETSGKTDAADGQKTASSSKYTGANTGGGEEDSQTEVPDGLKGNGVSQTSLLPEKNGTDLTSSGGSTTGNSRGASGGQQDNQSGGIHEDESQTGGGTPQGEGDTTGGTDEKTENGTGDNSSPNAGNGLSSGRDGSSTETEGTNDLHRENGILKQDNASDFPGDGFNDVSGGLPPDSADKGQENSSQTIKTEKLKSADLKVSALHADFALYAPLVYDQEPSFAPGSAYIKEIGSDILYVNDAQGNAIQNAAKAALAYVKGLYEKGSEEKMVTVVVNDGVYQGGLNIGKPENPSTSLDLAMEDLASQIGRMDQKQGASGPIRFSIVADDALDGAGNVTAGSKGGVRLEGNIHADLDNLNLMLAGIYITGKGKIQADHAESLTYYGTALDDRLTVEVSEGTGSVKVETGDGSDQVDLCVKKDSPAEAPAKEATSAPVPQAGAKGIDSRQKLTEPAAANPMVHKQVRGVNQTGKNPLQTVPNALPLKIQMNLGAGNDVLKLNYGMNRLTEDTCLESDNGDIIIEPATEVIDVTLSVKAKNGSIIYTDITVITEDDNDGRIGHLILEASKDLIQRSQLNGSKEGIYLTGINETDLPARADLHAGRNAEITEISSRFGRIGIRSDAGQITAGSILVRNGSISLQADNGDIGTSHNPLPVDTDAAAGGTLSAEANGNIYLKEITGDLILQKLEATGNAFIETPGSILDAHPESPLSEAAKAEYEARDSAYRADIADGRANILEQKTRERQQMADAEKKKLENLREELNDLGPRISAYEFLLNDSTLTEQEKQAQIQNILRGQTPEELAERKAELEKEKPELQRKADGIQAEADRARIRSDEARDQADSLRAAADQAEARAQAAKQAAAGYQPAIAVGGNLTLKAGGNLGTPDQPLDIDLDGSLDAQAGKNLGITNIGDLQLNRLISGGNAALILNGSLTRSEDCGPVHASGLELTSLNGSVGTGERPIVTEADQIQALGQEVHIHNRKNLQVNRVVGDRVNLEADGSITSGHQDDTNDILAENLVLSAKGDIGTWQDYLDAAVKNLTVKGRNISIDVHTLDLQVNGIQGNAVQLNADGNVSGGVIDAENLELASIGNIGKPEAPLDLNVSGQVDVSSQLGVIYMINRYQPGKETHDHAGTTQNMEQDSAYQHRELLNSDIGIMVSGLIHQAAELNAGMLDQSDLETLCPVSRKAMCSPARVAGCCIMLAHARIYPLWLGDLTVSIPVEDPYEGRTLLVLACDGKGGHVLLAAVVQGGRLVFETDFLGNFVIMDPRDCEAVRDVVEGFCENDPSHRLEITPEAQKILDGCIQ